MSLLCIVAYDNLQSLNERRALVLRKVVNGCKATKLLVM